VATTFIAAQLALVLRLPVSSYLPWSIAAAAGSGTILSYAILAEYFPKEIAGRANGALNLFHFGAAFVIQYIIGVVLAQWPSQDGHYPAIAYQVAFGLNLAMQTAARAWFALSRVRTRALIPVSAFRCGASGRTWIALGSNTPSRHPATGWDRLNSAHRHVACWRLAVTNARLSSRRRRPPRPPTPRLHTSSPGSSKTSDPYLSIQLLCGQIGSMPSIT
jgi:MFS family permease